MSTALNPRAVAFTPGGSMEEEAPARTYSLGPHCPWECPVLPPSSPLAIRDVMTRYFQEENVAGRNTVACGHFDERLRIAAEYAFDNGALSVSPLLLDTPKPLQQVCRAIASAISGFATTDASVVTPEMRDAVRQVTVMMPQELLAVLINSCSPLAADEVNPGEWDIAFSCAGSIVHLLAIATLFEKGIASCDAATVERLSSLRDAVLRHRGAGCLVKIALPMLAACRYAANMEGNAKHTYAVRWCRDLFPLALNFIFSLPPVGGLNELVAFSHSHFWSTMDSIPLGAIIVSETLQAYNSMTRLSMGGLVSRPFTGVAMMMTNPTLSHIRPPATRVLEEGHNTPPPPQVVTSPEMASSTAGDGAGTADVTRSPMQLPSMPSSTAADAAATQPSTATPNNSHVPHLLEEVGNHDASLMLAFALLAVTECNAVTVATAKRAVEAVELACDGDPSQLENTISRRPQPVIRDLMMVCESLIGRAPDQGDLLRRASECVLAREHGAAHASSLIIKGAPKASAPAVSPTSSSGPVNAQSAAAARYTRKLPSTTNATSPSSGLPLVSATLGMPTGRPLPRKPSGTKTGDDDFSSGGGWNVTAPPPHQGATW